MLRQADAIMLEELHAAGVYNDIGQAFVVLLPVKSVGVMGDGRTCESARALGPRARAFWPRARALAARDALGAAPSAEHRPRPARARSQGTRTCARSGACRRPTS